MADIKFSEFPKANQSKDSDEIAILQDGVNKMIPSPILESKIINKTVTRVTEQGGASLNIINLKGVVSTYADLATITPTPELNDAYQVEADGLVYVYTESGFQADGEGVKVQPDPNGVIEEGNVNAVSGGKVFDFVNINKYNIDIMPYINLINGYYINYINGDVLPDSGYSVTDFIYIKDVDYFKLNSNVFQQYSFFDENKNYISGTNFVADYINKPLNATYIRFTVKTGDDFYFKMYKDESIIENINKLNYNFTKKNHYLSAIYGNVVELEGYCFTDFIPVKSGDVVRYKSQDPNDNGDKQVAFFTNEFRFDYGYTDRKEITVLRDGYFVLSLEIHLFKNYVLTVNDTNINNLLINDNVVLKKSNIKGLFNPYSCFVSKNNGDFKTINEAVEYGKNLGTNTKKFTIYFEGEFNEVVNIAPYYIDLIGVSKKTSLIYTSTGSYTDSPLNVSCRNSGRDFSSIAFYDGVTPNDIWAYGIHCDSFGEGKGIWLNCDFISYVNAGVGLGTLHNQQYNFINCNIECKGGVNDGGALYMHNSPYPNAFLMSVLVKDCYIVSSKGYSLVIDDANENAGHNDDDGTTFTFINNMFWSDINGKTDTSILFSNAPTTGDIGQIKIGLKSYGNNVNKINK